MEGRLMVMLAPTDNSDSVEKEIMTGLFVGFKETRSVSFIANSLICSSPPIAGENENELNSFRKSLFVLICTPFSSGFLGKPVIKAAKVMDWAPAGSAALVVVHTMTRVAAVIVHPDNVAPGDTGMRVPSGVDGPVK